MVTAPDRSFYSVGNQLCAQSYRRQRGGSDHRRRPHDPVTGVWDFDEVRPSRASSAARAARRSSSRSAARAGRSARRAAAGAWPTPRRTWSIGCCRGRRTGSGCSAIPDACVLLARDARATTASASTFLQEVFRWQRRRAKLAGLKAAKTGAVTFTQRFGSRLNLNVHHHAVVPSDAYAIERVARSPFRSPIARSFNACQVLCGGRRAVRHSVWTAFAQDNAPCIRASTRSAQAARRRPVSSLSCASRRPRGG